MSFLLYKRTDNGVFDDFPKISDHFPKISEDFPKLSQRPDERSRTFSENFRKFPKMSEDFRRLPKTFDEDPKMFRWYTNEFKYNLRDKPDVTEIIDIFTCEDIISSHVRISYRFYQFVTTRYTTDFYIIKTINLLTPAPSATVRNEPWPFFHFWRHYFWPKLSSSVLNFCRRKDISNDAQIRVIGLMEPEICRKNAQKEEWKTQKNFLPQKLTASMTLS